MYPSPQPPPLPQVPTEEQHQAARTFLTTRERMISREEPGGGPETANAIRSWNWVIDRHLSLVHFAVQAGQYAEAARAWAVVLDALRTWQRSPDLPEVLRGPVIAAAAHSSFNPWEAPH